MHELRRRSIYLHAITSAPAPSTASTASASTAAATSTRPFIVDQINLFKFLDLWRLRNGLAGYAVGVHFPERETRQASHSEPRSGEGLPFGSRCFIILLHVLVDEVLLSGPSDFLDGQRPTVGDLSIELLDGLEHAFAFGELDAYNGSLCVAARECPGVSDGAALGEDSLRARVNY